MTTQKWMAVTLYALAVLVILLGVPDALGLNGKRFPVVLFAIPLVLFAQWLWKAGRRPE